MTTMPSSTHTITNFPFLLLRPDSNDIANDFMARDQRKDIAEHALTNDFVAVADTAGDDFDEDLALFGFVDWDVFEGKRLACFFGDEGFAGAGDVLCHFCRGVV